MKRAPRNEREASSFFQDSGFARVFNGNAFERSAPVRRRRPKSRLMKVARALGAFLLAPTPWGKS